MKIVQIQGKSPIMEIVFPCQKELLFNPLLHRLFLDYDIFLFLDNIEKNQEKILVKF